MAQRQWADQRAGQGAGEGHGGQLLRAGADPPLLHGRPFLFLRKQRQHLHSPGGPQRRCAADTSATNASSCGLEKPNVGEQNHRHGDQPHSSSSTAEGQYQLLRGRMHLPGLGAQQHVLPPAGSGAIGLLPWHAAACARARGCLCHDHLQHSLRAEQHGFACIGPGASGLHKGINTAWRQLRSVSNLLLSGNRGASNISDRQCRQCRGTQQWPLLKDA